MSLQEECRKVDGPFSTSHMFMDTHLQTLAYNVEGISVIMIELVLKILCHIPYNFFLW